jgi:hypothetical protein
LYSALIKLTKDGHPTSGSFQLRENDKKFYYKLYETPESIDNFQNMLEKTVIVKAENKQ